MIRWSPFIQTLFYLGGLAQAFFLLGSEMRVDHRLLAALVLAPYLVLRMLQRGKARVVARTHLAAMLWYIAITILVVGLALRGSRPPAWGLYLAMIAPGAAVATLFVTYRIRDAVFSTTGRPPARK